MSFIDFEPEENQVERTIPYLEDVSRITGWEGHTTGIDERTLIAQIMNEIGFMGAQVMDWRKGTFTDEYGKRSGYLFKMSVTLPDGRRMPAKLEVVSLPVKKPTRSKLDQSLRTALWNLRSVLAAGRRMESLVPGTERL